jgi:hypothetical protein
MGNYYSNITLYKAEQEELTNYLSNKRVEAYVSPTINNYTIVYLDYLKYSKVKDFIPNTREIWDTYGSNQATLIILASHLSQRFYCSALSVCVDNDYGFWYHLNKNGERLDEYYTHAYSSWVAGMPILSSSTTSIKGGNARVICNAFEKQDKILDAEIILHSPNGDNTEDEILNIHRYQDFLSLESFSLELRHQALSRCLGISPYWSVGQQYSSVNNSSDFEVVYEAVVPLDNDDDVSFEEALSQVSHSTY